MDMEEAIDVFPKDKENKVSESVNVVLPKIDIPSFKSRDILKEINELIEENKKLGNLKLKYVEFARQIKGMADQIGAIKSSLDNLSLEIDPIQGLWSKNKEMKKRGIYDEPINQIYEKMKAGTQVTSKFIEQIYPELDSGYIIKKLKELNGVKSRRDGISVVLYVSHQATD